MPDFLNIRKILTHYSFHISFFLLITTFLTWFQPLNFKSFFDSSGLKNLAVIKWLISNETTLFSLYIIFCCVESCVFILMAISHILHAFYSHEAKQIFSGMWLLNLWFTLLIFIFNNLGIFHYKISALLPYLETPSKRLLAALALLPSVFNAFLCFNITYGFFFHGES